MNGYHEAATVLNDWMERGIHTVLTAEQEAQFTIEFQKMCILDYLIRNTDRHLENWLIGQDPEDGTLHIAAIDNGLAFPTQHPETASIFRRFPFNWATLPWANQPWNDELRHDFLTKMTPTFLHTLCENLLHLFKHDRSHPRVLNYDQIRVLRGQVCSLLILLADNCSMYNGLGMEPATVRLQARDALPASEETSSPVEEKVGILIVQCVLAN